MAPQISFMDLPRELRDIVYHETWKITSNTVAMIDGLRPSDWPKGSRAILQVMYPHEHFRCTYGLPQWLRTSKAILNEGMVQLRREATWRFWDPCDIEPAECAAPPWPLLYPCVGRTLELELKMKLLHALSTDGTLTRRFRQSYHGGELAMFKRIVTDTADQEAIEDIQILLDVTYLVVEDRSDNPESRNNSFHLDILHALGVGFPSLRTLRIHLSYYDALSNQFRDLHQSVMLRFEDEVERIARLVLGNGCTGARSEDNVDTCRSMHRRYNFRRA